jgi:hypothetical protein
MIKFFQIGDVVLNVVSTDLADRSSEVSHKWDVNSEAIAFSPLPFYHGSPDRAFPKERSFSLQGTVMSTPYMPASYQIRQLLELGGKTYVDIIGYLPCPSCTTLGKCSSCGGKIQGKTNPTWLHTYGIVSAGKESEEDGMENMNSDDGMEFDFEVTLTDFWEPVNPFVWTWTSRKLTAFEYDDIPEDIMELRSGFPTAPDLIHIENIHNFYFRKRIFGNGLFYTNRWEAKYYRKAASPAIPTAFPINTSGYEFAVEKSLSDAAVISTVPSFLDDLGVQYWMTSYKKRVYFTKPTVYDIWIKTKGGHRLLIDDVSQSSKWHNEVNYTGYRVSGGVTPLYYNFSPGYHDVEVQFTSGGLWVEASGTQSGATGAIGDATTDFQQGQSFTTEGGIITQITVVLGVNTGTPTGTMTWQIRPDNAGQPSASILASGTFTPVASSTNTIPIVGSITLASGTLYWLVLKSTTAQTPGSNNRWTWNAATVGTYANGNRTSSSNGGATWSANAHDFDFSISTFLGTIESSGTQTGSFSALGNLSGSTYWIGQSFTCAAGLLTHFRFATAGNVGSPTGGISWEIRSNNGWNIAELTTGLFTESGTLYWLILYATNSTLASGNYYRWDAANPGSYANGTRAFSTNVGFSWTADAADNYFQVFVVDPYVEFDFETSSIDDDPFRDTVITNPTSWLTNEALFLLSSELWEVQHTVYGASNVISGQSGSGDHVNLSHILVPPTHLWNVPPKSLYQFTHLPNNGLISLTIKHKVGVWDWKEEYTSVDLTLLNSDLIALGYDGLLTSDILVFGYGLDPGIIIRGGAVLGDFRPQIDYSGLYAGETWTRRNEITVYSADNDVIYHYNHIYRGL